MIMQQRHHNSNGWCDYFIIEYNTPDLAELCAQSIIKHDSAGARNVWEIDAKANWVSYAQAANKAVAQSDAEFICILNADTEMLGNQDDIRAIFEENLDVVVVGPRQIGINGQLTHAGIFGTNEAPKHRAFGEPTRSYGKPQFIERIKDAVTVSGSVYFARRSVWAELGGFLEVCPHFFEETWFSYLVRHKGFRVVYTGATTWIHRWDSSLPEDNRVSESERIKNGNLKRRLFMQSQAAFRAECEKWGIKHD